MRVSSAALIVLLPMCLCQFVPSILRHHYGHRRRPVYQGRSYHSYTPTPYCPNTVTQVFTRTTVVTALVTAQQTLTRTQTIRETVGVITTQLETLTSIKQVCNCIQSSRDR